MAVLVLTYDSLAGKFFSQLIGADQLALAAVLSGKIGSGQIGSDHIVDLAATKLTGLIQQARISGLLTSSLMLSGGILPRDISFLPRPTPSGCVLDLGLNEGANLKVFDKSGSNNDGTITGATWADDLFGRILKFDGIDDVAHVPDAPSLKFGTGDFTASIWVKTTQSAGAGVYPIFFSKEDEADPRKGWAIFQATSTNNLGFGVWGDTEVIIWTTFRINDGKWHLIHGVKTSTLIKVFVDGVSMGSATAPTGSTDKAIQVNIGGNDNGNRWSSGAFSSPRAYNKAFTAAEIQGDYIDGLNKLGRFQGSRLLTSGWTTKIWLDPESADLQALSGAVRTSGIYYGGSFQVPIINSFGYIASAFISGGLPNALIASGYFGYKVTSGYPAGGLVGFVLPARVSGLPYANLALSGTIANTDILSGITAAKILSGYRGYDGASGYVLLAQGVGNLPVFGAMTLTVTQLIATAYNDVNPSANYDFATGNVPANQKKVIISLSVAAMHITETVYERVGKAYYNNVEKVSVTATRLTAVVGTWTGDGLTSLAAVKFTAMYTNVAGNYGMYGAFCHYAND